MLYFEGMKTYRIKYHFGRYDATPREHLFSLDAGFTLGQVASIFAARMDCHALVIDTLEAI
jgi:hypothetical protein